MLFDGVCNFCNGAVQFMVDHERQPAAMTFAPLQSDVAEALLVRTLGAEEARRLRSGVSGNGDPDSMVLVEGSKAYTHSHGALRIAKRLRAPWSFLAAFLIVPRPLRDLVYRYIARNRYRWFGKTESCRVPTKELRARFLA